MQNTETAQFAPHICIVLRLASWQDLTVQYIIINTKCDVHIATQITVDTNPLNSAKCRVLITNAVHPPQATKLL